MNICNNIMRKIPRKHAIYLEKTLLEMEPLHGCYGCKFTVTTTSYILKKIKEVLKSKSKKRVKIKSDSLGDAYISIIATDEQFKKVLECLTSGELSGRVEIIKYY